MPIRCPHCLRDIPKDWMQIRLFNQETATLSAVECPLCNEVSLGVQTGESFQIVYPAGQPRPVPVEVPIDLAADYREASAVIELSPKSSAALSRRSLQRLLRDIAGCKQGNLVDQIEEVTAAAGVPSFLAEQLHAIRQIGNFAAHPTKNTSTGEIVDVEPGEAEWCLDVLDGLFDYYFVQPEKAKQRKAVLNAKLAEHGKPQLP